MDYVNWVWMHSQGRGYMGQGCVYGWVQQRVDGLGCTVTVGGGKTNVQNIFLSANVYIYINTNISEDAD